MNTGEIFQHAKDDLLADGQHAPVLFVEYSDHTGHGCMEFYSFAPFGAETFFEGERMQFFNLGAQFGRDHGFVDFTCLTFLFEAWVSHVLPSQHREFARTYGRPSDDPNCKEYLIADSVELVPAPSGKQQMKQSIKRAEILRPALGIIDLKEETREVRITHLLFPGYFLAGYASTQIPDAQLQQIAEEVFGRWR